MIRTQLLLLLLSWGSMSGFCQAPGYLGKKFSFQGEFHSFPAFNGPTASNKGLQTYDENEGARFALNWSGGARLGYVVSRYGQAILSFDYLKTGMYQTAYFQTGLGDIGSNELFFELTGLTFGAGMRNFKPLKGGLAPMGAYTGYSFSATLLKGKLNEKYSTGTETFDIEATHIVPSFACEFGSNFVVKDVGLINLGAKLNFALSPRAVRHVFGEEEGWDPYANEKGLSFDEGNTENFKTNAASRFALHSILMIYVGVGLIQ